MITEAVREWSKSRRGEMDAREDPFKVYIGTSSRVRRAETITQTSHENTLYPACAATLFPVFLSTSEHLVFNRFELHGQGGYRCYAILLEAFMKSGKPAPYGPECITFA